VAGYSTGTAFCKALAEAEKLKRDASVDFLAEFEKVKAFVETETSLRVVKSTVLASDGAIQMVLGAK
jgi:hypothetical protein